MLRTEVEDFLAQGLDLMGLSLENQPEALARLALYFQELNKWNCKVNLVARTLDGRQILEDHFLDSLTLLEFFVPEIRQQESLLDIGTGAGFPGMVLKAVCPQLQVTLIEPRQSRFFFLKHIVRTLNLTGVSTLNVYLEEKSNADAISGQYFTFITSRAFTDIHRFLKLAFPYLAEDGRIIMMKGPAAVAELQTLMQNALPKQVRLEGKRKLLLPFSEKERWLVSFRRSG
jgi:16S rRNA (guanine527-N7)-methyltransferase